MQKSLYSLMLLDDVVKEIDKLAYQRNTNRSNLINQILAEYVEYKTPEMESSEIFQRMLDLLVSRDHFESLSQPTASRMGLRSQLVFKYNPTVKYQVELRRSSSQCIGILHVFMRTQNPELLGYLHDFYDCLTSLENRYLGNVEYDYEGGQFVRKLKVQPNPNNPQRGIDIGDAISTYIQTFDKALKTYFSCMADGENPILKIENILKEYYLKAPGLV